MSVDINLKDDIPSETRFVIKKEKVRRTSSLRILMSLVVLVRYRSGERKQNQGK